MTDDSTAKLLGVMKAERTIQHIHDEVYGTLAKDAFVGLLIGVPAVSLFFLAYWLGVPFEYAFGSLWIGVIGAALMVRRLRRKR